jgi:predicted MFS family arabinose efflux permease
MFIGDAARALMAILFIVNIFSFESIAVVIMINVVNETAELIHTSATTSIIPTLVNGDEITESVGISNATISVFELIGTVIGGFFYDAFGASFDGAGFTLSNPNVTQTFNNDIGLFGRVINAEVK